MSKNLLKIAPRMNNKHWRILAYSYIGYPYFGNENDDHLNQIKYTHLIFKDKKETIERIRARVSHWRIPENKQAYRELLNMLEEEND